MSCSNRLNEQTDVTKPIVAFRNFAEAPKSSRLFKIHMTVQRNFEDPLRGIAAACGIFKINQRKNCRHSLMILTDS
jgi:hypothetical protein